ncbi:MAG: nitrate- and nitrite sensing domain-containing protein [Oleibacter sp.]|nr:nitrate- and nitrite sensing domain-containing protein [Thalassolituus sp.]
MTLTAPSTEDFLIATKHCELHALQQLLINCGLVTKVTELIHEVQRERGLSNTFIVSKGLRFGSQLNQEFVAATSAIDSFKNVLSTLDLNNCPSSSARLFSSLAFVLHCLDGLTTHRESVSEGNVDATENTRFYTRLIAGLLTVVFEAADISSDPDITRALVAMFNFVQGKEYAGQERAWGLIGFTSGTFSTAIQERLRALQESQERCLTIFNDFTHTVAGALWRQHEQSEATEELGRLRKLIERYNEGNSLPTSISEVWYAVSTARIDQMQMVERELAKDLLERAAEKTCQAEEDLRLHHDNLKELANVESPPSAPLSLLSDSSSDPTVKVTSGSSAAYARSIFELVQSQAKRLKKASDELSEARQALEERKLIDKAKGILIQTHGIGEEEAYKQLRQSAMDNNKRIVDIAANIISVSVMLKPK